MAIMRFSSGFGIALFISSLAFAAPESKLADAVMNFDRDAVKTLLSQKVDVNSIQADGTTALHWAVRQDDADMVAMLLKAGANANAATRYGVAPLYLAATNGNAGIIEKLIAAGANPNWANPSGETALMTASRTGKADAIKALLDHGANVTAVEAEHGQTALMWASIENHPDAVKLLMAHGADVNASTRAEGETKAPSPDRYGTGGAGPGISRFRAAQAVSGGMTALLFAARDNKADMVRFLLENGADVNKPSANNTTPLVIAIVNNHIELAKYLIEKGANPNIADSYGRTALFAAVDIRNIGYSSFPDPHGDAGDPLDLIKTLIAHQANLNARSNKVPIRGWARRDGVWVNFDGQTPFLRAAISGDVAVMKLLIAAGADPKIGTYQGTTLMMAAAGIGWAKGQTLNRTQAEHLEAVKLCLENGVDLNAVNSNGWTALHGAANRGDDEIVKYLAEKGAKLDVKDTEGRTPLTFAEGVFLTVIAPTRHDTTVALIKQLMSAPTTASARP
jgi:ankyrin repeat protein